jgi:hypothetical protein
LCQLDPPFSIAAAQDGLNRIRAVIRSPPLSDACEGRRSAQIFLLAERRRAETIR